MSAARKAPLKVDIVVQGRFHAFALGRALRALGHDVLIHTNYPASVVERFGVPAACVRSFLPHGLLTRAVSKVGSNAQNLTVPMIHQQFGRWAAKSVRPDADLIYGFSGVMEELLLTPRPHADQRRVLVRGSAHIREQARLLEEERVRSGVNIDRPHFWIINREEREYELADRIAVLSTFAAESFARVAPNLLDKVFTNPLGVDLTRFDAKGDSIGERRARILAGQPLQVLTIGTFSHRKGIIDLIEVAKSMRPRLGFHFVGDFPAESSSLRRAAGNHIKLSARVPEEKLPAIYASADVFLFPTIEDGFAAVLLQAAACGLPIIATTNSSAPDIVKDGETGWIVPIRAPSAIRTHLEWCDQNRQSLAQMVDEVAKRSATHTWMAMATNLIRELFS
jgi:glycosyltransferase involved in cell wall biosynthesis